MIVYERLAYLEKMLTESRKLPLSDKVALDQIEAMEIIKEIKTALPDELKQAKWIADERKKIIIKAHMESDVIIQEAKEKVSEHQITLQAQEKATKILEKAREEATHIKKGSREYADNLFSELLEETNKMATIILDCKADLKE